MNANGFLINGSVVKYDYNSLDNKPSIPTGTGISDDLKAALLQLAEKVAYIDANGSDYYQDLYEALYNEPTYAVMNNLTDVTNSNAATRVTQGSSYSATLTPTSGYTINSVTVTMGGNDVTGTAYSSGTISIANVTGNIVITAVATQRQATLLSITATFSQGSAVIYDNATLDSLKQYLIVTANYDDSSSETLADSAYTLSGTLTAGTSTITASYGGKSDTFNVTVTHNVLPLYDWDFTSGLVDSVSSMTAVLAGGATRDSEGVKLTGTNQCVKLTDQKVTISDKTVIIDIPSGNLSLSGSTSHARLFSSSGNNNGNTSTSSACFVYQYNNGWNVYTGSAWGTKLNATTYPITFFDNKRLKLYIGSDMKVKVSYANMGSDEFTEIGTFAAAWQSTYSSGYLVLGGYNTNNTAPITISSLQIFDGEV